MSDQTRLVPVDPVHAEKVVREGLDRIGVPQRDAYAPVDVCMVLAHLGYDCTPGTLHEFIRKGYVFDPGEAWDCVAIYALTAALEARRRWLPTPCVHDLKKTGVRLQIEKLVADGVEQPIDNLDAHTVEDLLLQLTQSNNRHEREVLYETLRYKLAGYEE